MNLDNLEWEVLPPPEINENEESLPFPTHSGVLQIGGLKLKVYQLNTGQRIVDVNDLDALFDAAPKAE